MKKINNKGFALLETVIVSVFIVSIFTFVYTSVVPLIGRYEELSHDYNIESVYKLYYIRDAIYKDSNYKKIVSSRYKEISVDDFNDKNYFNSLVTSLFGDDEYRICYIRLLKNRASSAINDLSIKGSFKKYIINVSDKQTSSDYQNFIFLEWNGNYAYLGLAVDLNDLTNYQEPETIEDNTHVDTSGASKPLLMDGMIPIYYSYDDNAWHKADVTNKSTTHMWYDYNNLMWANIALVKEDKRSDIKNYSVGDTISENDIIGFYVWIPRFEYYIEGDAGRGSTDKSLPGEIDVKFIDTNASKLHTENNETWRTASAFTFGQDELTGFWFAKFEMSNSENRGFRYENNAVPYVIPESYSWTGLKIAEGYNIIQKFMNGSSSEKIYGLTSDKYTSDAHVMKNDEWGAVAYLSQSKYGKYNNPSYTGYKKEVYVNNRSDQNGSTAITGSSGGFPAIASPDVNFAKANVECATSSKNSSAACFKYFVEGQGTGASTAGTIYGVYDMSGGMQEYVMGMAGDTSNTTCSSKAYTGYGDNFTGFKGILAFTSQCQEDDNLITFPTNSKYYNMYTANVLSRACKNADGTSSVCYSHAMSETAGWYGDFNDRISKQSLWVIRGGQIEVSSGIFGVMGFSGSTTEEGVVNTANTTRPTIVVY